MTEKIKNYLGAALIFGVIIVSLSAWMYVRSYAESVEPNSYRSFAVSGEGRVVAVPDVALFSFSVITEGGQNLADLQKDNTAKVNRAIDFVKSQSVSDKDIKTEQYNVSPRYEYSSCPRDGGICPPPRIVGYTITQTVSVKIRDFEKIGEALAGVVTNGANSVTDITFTIDDQTVLENKARTEAIEKAKMKAEAVARAGDFRLGRLISLEEGFYPPTPYYAYGRGGAETALAKDAYAAPAIEPGSQDVMVTVTLRYEIK